MTDIPLEKLLPRANYSVYQLVSLAATRALELSEGRRCLVESPNSDKFTTMALEEIAAGKIETKGAFSAGKEKAQESKANDVAPEGVEAA